MATQPFSVDLADGRRARFVFTGRAHGDLRPRALDVAARRSVVTDPSASTDWTWMRQVHGNQVVVVAQPGDDAGADGDAAVTQASGSVMAIQTADCAPIALVATGGAVGVVHAGWRGLMAGVVEAAVDSLSSLAEGPIRAWLGPCIHPECYEFSPPDLEALVDHLGPAVAARTADGRPALDVPAAVHSVLAGCGIGVDTTLAGCTACGGQWYSHRARGEAERQILAAWIDNGP